MATSLSGGSGITRQDLTRRIYRELRDTPYQENVAGIAAAATSITLQSDATKRWHEGDIIDWDDDSGELSLLRATPNSTTGTVERGIWGTDDATHTGTVTIRKNPTFPTQEIHDAITAAIRALWPDIYEVKEENFAVATPVEHQYDMPVDAERVVGAYQKTTTAPERHIPRHFRPLTWVDSTASASEKTVEVQGVGTGDLSNLFILYLAQATLATLTVNQIEIVELDVKRRLTNAAALRAATEMEQQAFSRMSFNFNQMLADRITRERERLRQYLPRRDTRNYVGTPHYFDGGRATSVIRRD